MAIEIDWKARHKQFQRHVKEYFRALNDFGEAPPDTGEVERKRLYDDFIKKEKMVKLHAKTKYNGK